MLSKILVVKESIAIIFCRSCKHQYEKPCCIVLGGKTDTVRGKILEGENFGESLLTNQMARKILANQLAGLQLFHCIYNYWRGKFGDLYTIRQIRQNFPPPNFSHIR